MSNYRLVSCTFNRHADPILNILNDAIRNTTALFDYEPRPRESMAGWFEAKQSNGFPVIGVEAADGTLLGFASYGFFRAWPAYKYTVEHSVYVHKSHRGKGLGKALMCELIDNACANGVHAMVAGIDASNTGSLAMHERLGFNRVGTLPQVGFKFGRWLDLALYERLFDTPADPVDG